MKQDIYCGIKRKHLNEDYMQVLVIKSNVRIIINADMNARVDWQRQM